MIAVSVIISIIRGVHSTLPQCCIFPVTFFFIFHIMCIFVLLTSYLVYETASHLMAKGSSTEADAVEFFFGYHPW